MDGKVTTARLEEGKRYELFERLDSHPIQVVQEDKDDKKRPPGTLLYIEGVAGRAGIVNANGRYYPLHVYQKAVEKAQDLIKKGKFLGEVEHPWDGRGSLRDKAIRFTELYMDGDLMKYKGYVLDTEWGRHLAALLKGGVGVEVSTRGFGTVRYEKIGDEEVAVVTEDFELKGIDVVEDASNPYGRNVHFESKGGVGRMDLDQLRKEHPELVKQIEKEHEAKIRPELEAEIREGLQREFDEKVSVRVEERLVELRDEIRKEVLESEEVKQYVEAINKITEALRPFGKVIQDAQETEEQKKLRDLEERFTAIEEANKRLQEENAMLKAKVRESEIRAQVEAKLNELLEGYEHADVLRPRLAECKSVEELEQKFEAEKAFVESIVSKAKIPGKPSSTGRSAAFNEDERNKRLDNKALQEEAERERQRRLAGIV